MCPCDQARCAQIVMASRETWKYLVMCILTVNLKQIFRHVDATMPKFLIRYGTLQLPLCLHSPIMQLHRPTTCQAVKAWLKWEREVEHGCRVLRYLSSLLLSRCLLHTPEQAL